MVRRLMVSAVALVGVAAAWVWWLTSPDTLDPAGVTVSLEVVPGERAAVAGLATSFDRIVEIVSIRPASPPPEGASIELLACRWIEGREIGSTPRWRGSEEHCAETRPVEGLELAPLGPVRTEPGGWVMIGREWELVAVVDLGDQPSYGTEGFVVEYRDGRRRGTQASGMRIDVHRPGA